MKTVELKIKGMNCNHCVKSLTEALQELNGVKSVKVSLEKNNAVVEYDETKTDTNKIIETVKEIEFEASL